jgi:hypothetical protein
VTFSCPVGGVPGRIAPEDYHALRFGLPSSNPVNIGELSRQQRRHEAFHHAYIDRTVFPGFICASEGLVLGLPVLDNKIGDGLCAR